MSVQYHHPVTHTNEGPASFMILPVIDQPRRGPGLFNDHVLWCKKKCCKRYKKAGKKRCKKCPDKN